MRRTNRGPSAAAAAMERRTMQTTEQETPVTTEAEPLTTEVTPEANPEPTPEPPAEQSPSAEATPEPPASAEPTAATPEVKPDRLPFEQWARQKRPDPGDLMRAKVLRRWATGRYVTEAEFDAAITDARNLVFR